MVPSSHIMTHAYTLLVVAATAAVVAGGCTAPSARRATLTVSYYAQDTAFVSAEPLRVSVGAGNRRHRLRGAELMPYHPFLVSGDMPLDSGATLPVIVVVLGATADTAAIAELTLGPVEPATAYTLGVSAGGRNPSMGAPTACGAQVAVPIRRTNGARVGDSLFVSVTGMRDGVAC